jgi:glycosyltransferase involved in cell wall biosynthesis
MRAVLLSEFFCKGMGYLENMLPKYLALLGVDTHVVVTDLPIGYRQADSKRTYANFVERLRPGAVETIDGFKLHVLPHKKVAGHMRMTGLRAKLASLRPNIVQTETATGWIAFDAALYAPFLGYKLFTGNHHHASVFPLATKKVSKWSAASLDCLLKRTAPGKFIAAFTEKCYAISPDCADVAIRFFGAPSHKVTVCPLGVDTKLFHSINTREEAQARDALRSRLGFSTSDIVCIYTGRFSEEKNPLLLARAVGMLNREGQPYRGLFIGEGGQLAEIQSCAGCVTSPFVPVDALGSFYRAAEIGVWPAQESTSMLDAAACGLPIIANHTLTVTERLDGNGLTYRLNNLEDLVGALRKLGDAQTRSKLGIAGAHKMQTYFSWNVIARRRMFDYEASLSTRESVERKILTDEFH